MTGARAPEWDLVLVFTTFRRVMVYLPLVAALSRRFRVGILRIATDESRKTARTDALFLARCAALGAQEVPDAGEVNCRVAIVPQWPFTPTESAGLRDRLVAETRFALIGLTMGNYALESLGDFRLDGLLLVDADLYRFRLPHRPAELEWIRRRDVPLYEVGLPFLKHAAAPDLGIDYLIANPTPLSLPALRDRFEYLETVTRLLELIPPGKRVVLKQHNAEEAFDYLIVPAALAVTRGTLPRSLLRALAPILRAVARGLERVPAKPARLLAAAIEHVLIALAYRRLLERVQPLSALTPEHNFSLEIFLPAVRDGLITGRSNSIWHGLYCRLPVFNCVDESRIGVDPAKMNAQTMDYLSVPYCGGRLDFDRSAWGRVRDEVRGRDLVDFVLRALQGEPLPGRIPLANVL